MLHRINSREMAETLARALSEPDLLVDEDSAVVFHDLDRIDSHVVDIRAAFPARTLHALALKANPLPALIGPLAAQGFGAECASLVELHLALNAGVPADRIVFDSPAKTLAELRFAAERGIWINADSIEELNRLAGLQQPARTGLRINPQVGAGTIAMTSVAGSYSKFGVPLSDRRRDIIEAFKRFPWLTGLHLHIGSQGMSLDLLVEGVRRVLDLALEIPGVDTIDIGGGLPAAYRESDPVIPIAAYREALERRCPELFSGRYKLVTEFGRCVFANTGWAASRIEYVKPDGTIIHHLGADFLLRPVYRPEDWFHRISVADARGRLKTEPVARNHVGGPLCFAGDMLGKSLSLPHCVPGDYLLLHDVGAYTLSMWSRYCSRQAPKVLGHRSRGFTVLKQRESIEDVLRFWQ